MLTINISHIISTRKRGGYNPASKLNLHQYRGKENFTGEVKNTTKSKYRNILTNWFLTHEEGKKEGKKEERKKEKEISNASDCHLQEFVAIVAEESNCTSVFQNEISRSLGGTSPKPTTATSPKRKWQSSKDNINFITLTFPNQPTEAEAKISLKKYLATARTLGIDYYFWTMEKSGILGDNLHFHLLIQCPDATISTLSKRWDSITKSSSPHSTNAQKVYDYKGMIEYILKGHEFERDSRQFGMSRPLSDFAPIKLNDVEQADFCEEHEEDLRIFKVFDYFTILMPTTKLRRKILSVYHTRCINRKSEKERLAKILEVRKCNEKSEKLRQKVSRK